MLMSQPARPLAICLMGPTASGKSAIALALHDVLPVDIVSVDSSQIYRGMDIGTAKPTAEEQKRAPHRLIDIRDPAESYSAADFREDALREMGRIAASGRIPLLVGGTMFYFRALEYGLSALPSADADVRRRISEEAARKGWPSLHARLAEIDPETAARVRPSDPHRIQRALEIHAVTGQAPSALRRAVPERAPYRFVKIGLWPDRRAALHARMARRFEAMLERGLVGEVEALYRRGDLDLTRPSMRTVSYRQVWHYLTGSVDYNQMIQQAIAATRQLAKRQMTWLRRYPDVRFLDCSDDPPIEAALDNVRRFTC
ncbi:tRNA delta(2)-isopentenylpyrophosphate transferase [Sulfurifustis variabilis]|uniref:tRNA dimethylallyltransferase n=2 Tax=Sulfurifustis variabilis TaxID=1675686 RepID=A0A1B4V7B5_9GAMM|nr:tRNA delta(2)-isopentenylpyrophosphate transferase [Sulfurifustis variabilis]